MDLSFLTNPGPATGPDGLRVPDVFIVDTRGGLAPHLVWSTTPERTLCGLELHVSTRTWFELAGCAKCRKAARTAGIVTITDVDGDVIEL